MKVAVIGATGAVGTVLLRILGERKFPVTELVPFAAPRSEGRELSWAGGTARCRVLKEGCFKGIDIAFFDASDEVSRDWVPEAAKSGTWVVDNSATFRMESDVPLVVPEVNGKALESHKPSSDWRSRVIAGPNCSTVQLVVALEPIRRKWGLKRVIVSSYQSVSGAGSPALDELTEQTEGALRKAPSAPRIFPHPIAFNVIPQIGGFKDDGYTSEEHKIMAESRKILGLPGLKVTATAVRVPTYLGHCESVQVECEKSFDLSEVREALRGFPGVEVVDDPSRSVYPMAVTSAGKDPVYVGRIRRDPSAENGLNLWVVSDNLRKGAALNAVQIGELLVNRGR